MTSTQQHPKNMNFDYRYRNTDMDLPVVDDPIPFNVFPTANPTEPTIKTIGTEVNVSGILMALVVVVLMVVAMIICYYRYRCWKLRNAKVTNESNVKETEETISAPVPSSSCPLSVSSSESIDRLNWFNSDTVQSNTLSLSTPQWINRFQRCNSYTSDPAQSNTSSQSHPSHPSSYEDAIDEDEDVH